MLWNLLQVFKKRSCNHRAKLPENLRTFLMLEALGI